MKKFMLAAITMMSFSAFAQTMPIESRIENRLERLNDLVMRQQSHRYVTQEQKQQILRNINEAILAIQADTTPNPNPNPVPNPIPNPIPNPPHLIVAEGKIENHNFRFEASTIGQVFNQCSDFVRARLSQADDLMVSFNGKAYIRQTTSGWWVGADAICNVIYNQATPQNLTPDAYQTLVVEGYIENLRVEFTGSSYGEVFNKCVRTVESKFSQADDMDISVNGDRRYRQTTSGWWVGAHTICQVVMKNVPKL